MALSRDLLPETSGEPLVAPRLRLISPPEWSAGKVVTVLGEGFVGPQHAQTFVELSGTFSDVRGKTAAVRWVSQATYRNAGRVELVFEAGAPPASFGHEVGYFVGEARVESRRGAESAVSEPLVVSFDVGPSLLVWKLAPSATACPDARVAATLSDQLLDLDLEATGLAPTSTYSPLTLTATYTDLAGRVRTASKVLTDGRSARLSLAPGALPAGRAYADVFVNLKAEDGAGETLERSAVVGVGLPYYVAYDGNVRVAELFAPVQVSSCLPGGEFGRDVTYTGGQSESRSRSVSLSANVSFDLWVVNAGFGLNVSETLSSDTSQSLSISGRVLPGQWGVFYRQTQRLERLGQILRRDACGASFSIGEAHLTDWNWAPDLALTRDGRCPPAPPTNLPPAQVYP